MDSSNLKEKTARGLFWGSVSNGVQQLLALVIGIFLARRLMPEEYFMVAVLTVFSLLASNLQDSGFQNAIAVKTRAVHRDYNAVFWFSVGVSIVLYIGLFFLAPCIARFNHTPQLTTLARISFLGFVLSSLGIAHSAYLFRNLMVKQRMIATFTGVCVSGVVGISMVYSGLSYWGLVGQDLTYKCVVMLMYWRMSPWRPTFHLNLWPVFHMFRFSSKILATNMLLTVNNQFLQAVLGHYYPKNEVGLYSQSNKWNTMGYTLISGTLNGVAQPVMAGVGSADERLCRVFRKMLRFTAFVSFPAMLGLALIAPEFVPLVLKSQWSACVPYLRILCVAGAFIPLSQLYSNLLISRRRSGGFLLGTALMLLVQLGLMVGLSLSGGNIQTLLYAIATMQILWLGVWHFLARSVLKVRLVWMLKDIVPFLAISLIAMGVAQLAASWTPNLWLRMVLKIVVAVVCYTGIMQMFGVVIFRECTDFMLQILHLRSSKK